MTLYKLIKLYHGFNFVAKLTNTIKEHKKSCFSKKTHCQARIEEVGMSHNSKCLKFTIIPQIIKLRNKVGILNCRSSQLCIIKLEINPSLFLSALIIAPVCVLELEVEEALIKFTKLNYKANQSIRTY